MRFEARELKDYAEPVTAERLQTGQVYFSVQFLDEDLLVPIVEPFVYLGLNLRSGDLNRLYFQTFDSYSQGIRLTAMEQERFNFQVASKEQIKHIFEYEQALDVLMNCSLRRRKLHPQRRDFS